MKGKEIFRITKYFIFGSSRALKVFPYCIRKFMYDLSMSLPTRIGVLFRYCILKSLCAEIGDNVYISRYVVIKEFSELKIGDNVSVHEFSYIDASGGVNIGNNVSIAHKVSILSFEHGYEKKDIPIKYNDLKFKPVNICSDVWIGCGVIVLSGTVISSRSIIAAGAVVVNDVSSNSIYAGIPAVKIKSI